MHPQIKYGTRTLMNKGDMLYLGLGGGSDGWMDSLKNYLPPNSNLEAKIFEINLSVM